MDWSKFGALDVRWIYIIMLVVIIVPLFKPLGLPMSVSPEAKAYAETIDALPAGSVVWIGADYSPGSAARTMLNLPLLSSML